MTDIILHHYPTSPFAQKVRSIFGYKGMAWKSVHIPTVMPKPDLVALTGGYRKTPVLQIGADIYCDTKLIARIIESIQPEPALIPAKLQASIAIHEAWTEQNLFFLVVPLVMRPEGMAHFFSKLPQGAMEYFQKDRQALFASGSGRRPSAKQTANELPGTLALLDAQLAASAFLLGENPTLADFSVFHPLWFLRSNPGVAKTLDPYPHLLAWYDRIAAMGQGQVTPLMSTEALEIARASTPKLPKDKGCEDPNGLKIGDAVVIHATDYGTDPVKGELLASTADEVTIKRHDDRAGEVIVHFPRQGFTLAADTR